MAVARPELTVRAILTGMVLGALLTPCNVYSGLKIGWSFNMSIAAGLLAFGLWRIGERTLDTRRWGLLENNINQTTASSSASIISGGLVAPIPALTLLTGQTLSWPVLVFWVFAVSALGIVVAAGLRTQFLERDRLAFPAGIATAETMQRVHAEGSEGRGRLGILMGGVAVSGALKVATDLVLAVPRVSWAMEMPSAAALRGSVAVSPTIANLGFALEPSLLMIGFGAIIGLRAGLSLLLGALAGWGVLAPIALSHGWVSAGEPRPDAPWFAAVVEWLLWPGVALMVMAAVTSFAISLWRLYRQRLQRRVESAPPTMSRRAFLAGFLATLLLATTGQIAIFGIGPWEAVLAVLLSFALAVVAGRVSGETGITPIGATGKITQLTFGMVTPGDATANLMSANVTGGAAGQCADLLHDLRTGQIIGATPRFQVIAQVFGVLTGSLIGSLVYVVLIPDPRAMLITAEWPAPAVATWKAVAEVLTGGLAAAPPGAVAAMGIAAAAGAGLALAEKKLPRGWARLVPSAPALGLAFVIPAWNSISLVLGALAAAAFAKLAGPGGQGWMLALAAGLVGGESLAGVSIAMARLLG